jgi:hypothetical protein
VELLQVMDLGARGRLPEEVILDVATLMFRAIHSETVAGC